MINTLDELHDTKGYQPDLDSTINTPTEAELWDEIYAQQAIIARHTADTSIADGEPF